MESIKELEELENIIELNKLIFRLKQLCDNDGSKCEILSNGCDYIFTEAMKNGKKWITLKKIEFNKKLPKSL